MNHKILSVAVASLMVAGSAFAQSTTESAKKTTTTETVNQPAGTTESANTGSYDHAHSDHHKATKKSVKTKKAPAKEAEHTSTYRDRSDMSDSGAYTGGSGYTSSSNMNDVSTDTATTTRSSADAVDNSAYNNQNYDGRTGATYQNTTTTEEYNTTTSAPLGTGTSYGVNTYVPEQTLRSETFSFAPQFGVVTFTDATGETDSRSTVGLGLNFNMIPSSPENPKNGYFGLSTGAFYSHLGGPGSNFWGQDDNSGFNQGANLVLIPANLKLGYNFSDSFRASIHGGGNVIYRSAPEAAILGSGSDVNTNSWAILPNAGLDLEWQVGDNVAIIARPDVTIAPGNNMFVGTLGATIMPSF